MEMREALRLLRSETGLTQTELAHALHISFSTVSRWENKNTRPNQSAAVAVVELAKKRRVSSNCLDALNKVLFTPRVNDRADRALARQVAETLRLRRRMLLTSDQLKMTIDNLDLAVVAQRAYHNAPDTPDLFYYNSPLAKLFDYTAEEFAIICRGDPYFAVVPESREALRKKLLLVLSAELDPSELNSVVQALRKDGTRIWLEIRAISMTEYSYGRELFTSCRDVTQRVDAERKYAMEVGRQMASMQGYYASVHCDLNDNAVLRHSGIAALTGAERQGETADALLSRIADAAAPGTEREEFRRRFSCAALLAAFSRDEVLDYAELYGETAQRWLRADYLLVKNPYNNHVEMMLHFRDIKKQMLAEKLMSNVAHSLFDYIGCIDVGTGLLEDYFISDTVRPMPERPDGESYQASCEAQLRRRGFAGDIEKDLELVSLSRIRQKLEGVPFCCQRVDVRDQNGESKQKKLIYTYLDDLRKQIIVAQCDMALLRRRYESALDPGAED